MLPPPTADEEMKAKRKAAKAAKQAEPRPGASSRPEPVTAADQTSEVTATSGVCGEHSDGQANTPSGSYQSRRGWRS